MIFILFSASCKPPQLSQWNLLRSHNISSSENLRKQLVTDECCSRSTDRSKNASSRWDVFSHVKHRVSDVSVPSKSSCTQPVLLLIAGATTPFGSVSPTSVIRDLENCSTFSTTSFNNRFKNSCASWCIGVRNISLSRRRISRNLCGLTTPMRDRFAMTASKMSFKDVKSDSDMP